MLKAVLIEKPKKNKVKVEYTEADIQKRISINGGVEIRHIMSALGLEERITRKWLKEKGYKPLKKVGESHLAIYSEEIFRCAQSASVQSGNKKVKKYKKVSKTINKDSLKKAVVVTELAKEFTPEEDLQMITALLGKHKNELNSFIPAEYKSPLLLNTDYKVDLYKIKFSNYFARNAHNTIFGKPKEFADKFYESINVTTIDQIKDYEKSYSYLKSFYRTVKKG
jgi:hypothetical protein